LTVQGSAIVGTPKNSGTSSVELRAVMAAGDVRDSITIRIQGDSIGRFLPQIQASDVSSSRGRTLTRDAQNNLYYVSVLSNDTRDYNLGVGADVVSELGPALVVTRINSNGTYGWSQKVTGVTTVGGLAVSDSSVYVLSYTSSPVQIGIGNTTQKLTVNDDAFIAALDNATGAARSGFGTNGIQILTSSGDDRVFDGVVVGNTLYVTGSFDGINFGIGAPGALSSTTTTGYVAALNATSGTAVSAFGASGIQRIVSSSRTNGYFIVSSSGALYVAGEFNGNGLGIGAAGTLNSIGSTDVYVAGLVQDTGAALPGFGTSGVIRIGSSGAESVYGLEVGGETLYAVGNFSGSGLGIGAAGSVNSVGGTNTFLAAVSKATGLSLGTFGTAGLQTVGGANTFNTRLAVGNGGVYLAGTFNSNTLGIGGAGTFATSGSEDAFIAALHLETGQALTSFGTNGLQKVGGSSFDRSNSVVTTPGKIWSFLVSSSFNLGVGGVGTYSITPNGYLFPLDPATGQTPLIPTLLITSATASSGAQHVPFANYTITASEALVSSSATGLPPGLTLAGHIISGTPQSIGEFNVQLSATGVRGQVAAATLKITVTGDRIAATFPPLFAAAHALDTLRLTFDAAGNRYVTGRFSTTLDFNPGPGADSRQPNGLDVFVTRFNADGSYAWTSLIGGSGSDYARGIATDGTRVYVCGEQGGPNFGINGTNTLGGVLHNSQVFVACLDATNGSAVASFGNSGLQSINGSFVYARDLLLTPNGVVVAGSFGTTPSTGLRVGQTTTTRIASDSSNGFVLRLNPFTGALDTSFGPDGVRVVAGSSSDVVSTLSYNTGVLYCAGDFFSRNMGLEIPGEFFSQATDGFVFALNEANGAILTDFGRNGIQSIVGSDSESILAMAVQGGRLFVAGKSQSINLGIGKIGNGFAGDPDDDDESSAFIAALDATTGQAISGFGTNGLVIERVPGEQDFSVLRIAGGSVYALQRQGAIYQLGGASSTNYLSLLCEYDATTGAVGTHLAGGKMLLDGNMADYGRDLALHGSTWIAGTTGSTDFCGKWRAQDGFNGFMIPVDVTGMPPPPALEGPFDLYATVGVPFNYTPMFEGGGDAQTATYSALPAGLSQEDVSITGTPALSGDYEVSATISVAVSGYTVKTILRIHVRGNETANTSLPLVRGGGSAVRIASDAQNNLYVAGTFSDQRDFNPGSGADLKQASGTDDLFVTRFNADGSYAWTHVFSSPGDDELSALVVADATVFVAGAQNNNQALPGAPGLPTFPFRDGVVFALNSASGQPRAGFTPVRLIGNADTIVNAIAVRNGTLFTVGTFSSSNLNNGSLENVASRGGSDVFFSKFNASTGGQLSTFSGVRSFVTFGGSNTETATSLCVTDTTVYVGGVFNSPNAGLGGYGGAVTLQDSSFILKLDPVSGAADPSFGIDGILKLGSTGVTRLSALLLRSGILYAGGSYSGILGLNDFEVLIVMGQGASDGFVAALDAVSGENVTSFGQNGFTSIGGSGTDAVLALHEHDGTLAAAGVFASPNFGVTQPGDLIALPTALSGVRSNDGFVARLNLETGAKTAATIFHSSSPGTENAQSLAVVNGTLHAAGYADQASVVINGRGPYDARGWNAYIAPVVEPTQPNLPPLITQGVQLDFVRAEDSGVLSFGLDASDPEAQTIVWSIVGGDGQLVLGTQSNQGQHAEFSFTPQLNQTGSVVFSVRATDSEGASDTILIRVTLTPQNDAPVFTSGISATPNPATIGTVVQFSALATDPDGTAPVITWDFGDGAQAIGATASHAYVSGGVYVVTVTVNDGQGGVIIDALTLSVIPHAGPDSDNDGFNDDVEIAAGSDPNDSSSTPFGALPDQSEFLQGASLRITLQFPPAPTGRDAIRLKCLLPVAGNFAPAQTELLVNVGGVMRRLVHDVKGRVKMPAEKSTLSKRSSRTGMATLNVAFTGSFAEKLSGYGLTAPKAKGSAKVPVEVLMGRTYFKATPTLKYSSNGKKGSAR
jgi:hypothetical protein